MCFRVFFWNTFVMKRNFWCKKVVKQFQKICWCKKSQWWWPNKKLFYIKKFKEIFSLRKIVNKSKCRVGLLAYNAPPSKSPFHLVSIQTISVVRSRRERPRLIRL
jgi:hypothetical protein